MTIVRIIATRSVNINNFRLVSKCTTRGDTNPSTTTPNRKCQVIVRVNPNLTFANTGSCSWCFVLVVVIKPTSSGFCSKDIVVSTFSIRICNLVCKLNLISIFNLIKINRIVSKTNSNSTITIISNGYTIRTTNVISNYFIDVVIKSTSSRNSNIIIRHDIASSSQLSLSKCIVYFILESCVQGCCSSNLGVIAHPSITIIQGIVVTIPIVIL